MDGDGRNKHFSLEGGAFLAKKKKTPLSGGFGRPYQHTNC